MYRFKFDNVSIFFNSWFEIFVFEVHNQNKENPLLEIVKGFFIFIKVKPNIFVNPYFRGFSTKRLRLGLMYNFDKEYMIDLRYILNKNFGIRTYYDSDMGFGVGLNLNY
jgi:hypothetical protein